MARVSKGRKKASGGESSPEARCTLGAPLTWLFLVGLRPRRARLRFTKHNYYRPSVTVMLEKTRNRALTCGRLWVSPELEFSEPLDYPVPPGLDSGLSEIKSPITCNLLRYFH